MTQLTHVETVMPGLYASQPEPLPFAPALHIRAFLLQRERGNLLIYSSTGLESDAASIDELGGVARHYLGHRHEAAFASDWIRAPLFVHEEERRSVERSCRVRGTFSRRHRFEDDFEVIPIPGHTRGSSAYLWDSGEHRFLFTADTIYLNGGEWAAAVLDSSDRAAYLQSLELLKGLEFDVLVPWAATAGDPAHAVTGHAAARRRIDEIQERLRRGEDS